MATLEISFLLMVLYRIERGEEIGACEKTFLPTSPIPSLSKNCGDLAHTKCTKIIRRKAHQY
jgi:hypothetical protein